MLRGLLQSHDLDEASSRKRDRVRTWRDPFMIGEQNDGMHNNR